jgi:hypothetical protein
MSNGSGRCCILNSQRPGSNRCHAALRVMLATLSIHHSMAEKTHDRQDLMVASKARDTPA